MKDLSRFAIAVTISLFWGLIAGASLGFMDSSKFLFAATLFLAPILVAPAAFFWVGWNMNPDQRALRRGISGALLALAFGAAWYMFALWLQLATGALVGSYAA